jgi:mucin-19
MNEGVDKQIGAERSLADQKATETGTTGTSGAAATPKAETSEGGVSVAAAVGVNIADSTARAFIPDNGTVSSGGLLTLSRATRPMPRPRPTAAPSAPRTRTARPA